MKRKKIRLSKHAIDKIRILATHGFTIEAKLIEDTLSFPETLGEGQGGRKIASKQIDPNHDLRVIFEEHPDEVVVITLYPTKRK